MDNALTDVKQRNQELAKRINAEARSNPNSPYAGKVVGLADGQVVIVADSLDEVDDYLRQLGVDLRRLFWVEASINYDEVQPIYAS